MPFLDAEIWQYLPYFEQKGNGPEPLVFLHGSTSTHVWWMPAPDRLSSRYQSFALDLPAFGFSMNDGGTVMIGEKWIPADRRPSTVNYQGAPMELVKFLHKSIEALGLRRFGLVGHELGGGLALLYALEHQDQLSGLVQVDPLAPLGFSRFPDLTPWIAAWTQDPPIDRIPDYGSANRGYRARPQCLAGGAASARRTSAGLHQSRHSGLLGVCPAYTLCDNYVTSVATESEPNHLFVIAADAPIVDNASAHRSYHPRPRYDLVSLPETLATASRGWRNYNDTTTSSFKMSYLVAAGATVG
jgi:pimeloyl-ACP methyl ester carboxylesterase